MSKRAIVVFMLGTMWIGGAALMLTACEKHDGPAEEIGEAIDNAVDEAKDKVD